MFEALSEERDNEYAMIDSTIVRAHPHSAGAAGSEKELECIGASRGGLSTKIHASCDALGNPTGLHLSPGQASELDGADALMPTLVEADAVLADRGCDVDARMLEPLAASATEAVVPSKRTRVVARAYDRHLYKARHLIENFFARLKQYRALATRYDKTAVIFLGAIHLAAALDWLA